MDALSVSEANLESYQLYNHYFYCLVLRENVFDCLTELGLNDFLDEANQLPDIMERFESSDRITVFALSDEVFAGLDDITRGQLLISAHIGEGSFPENKLFNGRMIETLASNVSLHIGRTGNKTVEVLCILKGCVYTDNYIFLPCFQLGILREWSADFSAKCLPSSQWCSAHYR